MSKDDDPSDLSTSERQSPPVLVSLLLVLLLVAAIAWLSMSLGGR